MRAILLLATVSLATVMAPNAPRRYVVVPTSVSADTGVRPCPPSLSADGTRVAFDAHVSLDPADGNGRPDVYLLELASNRLTLVSRNVVGRAGRGSSRCPRMSDDGRRVVFESDATDLVDVDPGDMTGVFLFDTNTGVLRRIAPTRIAGPAVSARPAISADGQVVVFDARPVDATPEQHLHVYRVTVDGPGDVEDLGEGHGATVSGNGRVVAFVATLRRGGPQVIRVVAPESTRTFAGSAGTMGDSDLGAPTLSADGLWMAYVSRPRSTRIGGTNAPRSLVAVERLSDGLRQEVSVPSHGREANGICRWPAVDAAGSRVAFESSATNIGCDGTGSARCDTDINLVSDIFLWDRTTGKVTRVNVATDDLPWLEGAGYPSISRDGRSIAFLSRQPVSGADDRDTLDLFITRP
jgi:Tol biopolymer transport system component